MRTRINHRRLCRLHLLLACLFAAGLGRELHAAPRTWTSLDGQSIEAEFVNVIGTKAVLRDAEGKLHKVPLSQLVEADRTFIELAQPPEFKIDFRKDSEQHIWPQREKAYEDWELPGAIDYSFGVRLKQMSAGTYNHEVHVEFYAIGEEIDGDNYILLDRQQVSFVPAVQEELTYEFMSERKVRLFDYEFFQDGRRGQKYGGYLIIVTDSRGEVIAHKSPQNWIYGNIENLMKLPVGCHFDKSCTRVFPPRPKSGRQKSG